MAEYTLDSILQRLSYHRQRATYGAVAGLLGDVDQRSFMNTRPRDPFHSWVVRASDGQPTGYRDDQKHPELLLRSEILRDPESLADWLAAHP